MRRALIFFAVPYLAILVAACGGGGNDGVDAPPATVAATAAISSSSAGTTATASTAPAGTGGGQTGAASQVDACSLLTAQEVGAALGKDVGEGEVAVAVNGNASACEWDSVDGAAGAFIEVLTRNGKSWYEAVNFDHDKETVEGIGDEALFDSIGVLDVLDGDTFVSVQIILFFSDVDELTAARTLAQRVLDQLP